MVLAVAAAVVTAAPALAGAPATGVATTTTVTAPDAPTNVTALAGDGQATVSWTAPVSDGGSPIVSYRVASQPGTASASAGATDTSATVTSLANGVSYTFTVKATNAAGLTSVASVKSDPVVPTGSTTTTVPDAPTGVTAVAGDGQATVSWTAPANDGGLPITKYRVSSQPGSTSVSTADGSTTSVLFPGLTAGVQYTFTVRALNDMGQSAASAPSAPVTILGTPAAVPGAPTDVTATAGDGVATVSWTAPADDGGSPVTEYRINVQPGTTTVKVTPTTAGSPPPTTATFTPLTNGQPVTFTVKAVNRVGQSAASAPSNSVTPGTAANVPGAPTSVTAVAGDASAKVSWKPPTADGGSPVTAYRVSIQPGKTSQTVDAPATTASFTGLANGVSYTFTVRAANVAGYSVASAPSAPVTPSGSVTATVPGAPTNVRARPGIRSATVTWTAPASNGGSALTQYRVTSQPGNYFTVVPATDTTARITVPAGSRFSFTVRAFNVVGQSAPSTASNYVLTRGLGDWTGDGKPDLFGIRNGALMLYTGNGTGGFLTGKGVQIGTGWGSFTKVFSPGDWNGDGKADLVGATSDGRLLLYTGNGTGGFLTGKAVQIGTGWGSFTTVISPGDWNGDGTSDLLAVNSSGALLLYAGNGTGGFLTGRAVQIGSGWTMFRQVFSAGDWNGDGKADVFGRTPGGSLYSYTGNGAGGFTASPRHSVGSGWQMYNRLLSAGDWNGDGKTDLMGRTPAGALVLYTGNGAGWFTSPASRTIGSGWQAFQKVLSAGV